jgi:hypothetical protein
MIYNIHKVEIQIRIRRVIDSHWKMILISLGLMLFLINVAIFYPGYMSADTLRYLSQATGSSPITNLQPFEFVLLWKLLIFITGKVSSILILQLLVLWSSLIILSIYIYKNTKNKYISFMPLIMGLLPIIINISGVIWADNHLAFFLLLAISLTLYFGSESIVGSRKAIGISFIAIMLVVYAGLVRNNSAIIIVPISYLIIYKFYKFTALKTFLLSICVLFFAFSISLLGGIVFVEKKITNTAGPMSDDIVHILTVDEINKLDINSNLKKSLLTYRNCTIENNIVIDLFPCGKEQDKTNILITYPLEVSNIWGKTLAEHPYRYVERRITVFMYVLFPPEGRGYIWHDGIDENRYGIKDKFEGLSEINRMYVFNFGYKHFQFLYEPWFWLFANFGLLIYSRNLRRLKIYVSLISLSGLLYIATFIPTGVAADYRYIYWPVLAAITSMILVITDKNMLTVNNKKSKVKTTNNKKKMQIK